MEKTNLELYELVIKGMPWDQSNVVAHRMIGSLSGLVDRMMWIKALQVAMIPFANASTPAPQTEATTTATPAAEPQ